MHPPTHDTLPKVGVIGAGRLGSALTTALRAAGQPVLGPARRGAIPAGCHALVLCVPDVEIAAAAAAVAGAAPLVGHTSGATPLSALDAAGGQAFGWHPLQTFTASPADATSPTTDAPSPLTDAPSPLTDAPPPTTDAPPPTTDAPPPTTDAPPAAALAPFAGAGCAVAGATPAALAFAGDLARCLGMTPFEIDDAGRAAYHAAASIASNFLVTLQAAAEQVAIGAGLSPDDARALLAPLVRRTIENHAALGPERALTGPVARGDDATVAAQRDAVEQAAPELLALFDELVHHTRRLAGREALA